MLNTSSEAYVARKWSSSDGGHFQITWEKLLCSDENRACNQVFLERYRLRMTFDFFLLQIINLFIFFKMYESLALKTHVIIIFTVPNIIQKTCWNSWSTRKVGRRYAVNLGLLLSSFHTIVSELIFLVYKQASVYKLTIRVAHNHFTFSRIECFLEKLWKHVMKSLPRHSRGYTRDMDSTLANENLHRNFVLSNTLLYITH